MGNCCAKSGAAEEPSSAFELTTEQQTQSIDQCSQTLNTVEVVYNQGPLGIKVIPDSNARYIVVQDLIDTECSLNQTEIYNNMVPSHRKVMPGMKIVEIDRKDITGLPYNEVLAMLRRQSRPMYIGFSL